VLGAAISALSFRSVGEGIGRVPWRAVAMHSASFVAFAIGMQTIGFTGADAALIVLSALAGRESRWIEIAIECVVLIAASWAVFIYGIELPFPLWGSY